MRHGVHGLRRSRIVGPGIAKIKYCFLFGGDTVHTLYDGLGEKREFKFEALGVFYLYLNTNKSK